jgi:hypothetical protein
LNEELDSYKEYLTNSATFSSINTNDISEHIFDEYLNELKNLNIIKHNSQTSTTYLNNKNDKSQQVNQNLILNICNEINELNK